MKETGDKIQETFPSLQMKKQKEKETRAKMWAIEQQMKASAKFAEENGGA